MELFITWIFWIMIFATIVRLFGVAFATFPIKTELTIGSEIVKIFIWTGFILWAGFLLHGKGI